MQLTPATQWSQEQLEAAEYDLGTLVGPSLSGKALTLYRMLSESWWTGGLIHSFSIERNGVPKVRSIWAREHAGYLLSRCCSKAAGSVVYCTPQLVYLKCGQRCFLCGLLWQATRALGCQGSLALDAAPKPCPPISITHFHMCCRPPPFHLDSHVSLIVLTVYATGDTGSPTVSLAARLFHSTSHGNEAFLVCMAAGLLAIKECLAGCLFAWLFYLLLGCSAWVRNRQVHAAITAQKHSV